MSEPISENIIIDGAPVIVDIDRPGQQARLAFDASSNQEINIGISEIKYDTDSALVGLAASLISPDGAVLEQKIIVGNRNNELDVEPLATSGSYVIVIQPEDALTVGLKLTLSEPIVQAIEIGGASENVNLDRPGQDIRFTFEGTIGQRLSLGVSNVGLNSGDSLGVFVFSPDGAELDSTSITGQTGRDLDLAPLASAGVYHILLDARPAALASFTLTLSEPVSGNLVIGGPSITLQLPRPGQNARLSFDASAGQRIRLSLNDVDFGIAGSLSTGEISIVDPNNSVLTTSTISSGDSNLDTSPLPIDGNYTILADPGILTVVNMVVSLTEL